MIADFFNLLKAVLFFVVCVSAGFMSGYLLGWHRVPLPYLSKYISAPAKSSKANTAPLALTSTQTAKFLNLSAPETAASLKGKYSWYKFLPYAERAFKFSLVLPTSLKADAPRLHIDRGSLLENLDAGSDEPVNLACLYAGDGSPASVEVKALKLEPEIGLADFYKKLLSKLAAAMPAELPETGGRKHVLLSYTDQSGQAVLCRTTAVRAGNYVIYLQCWARQSEYSLYSDSFNLAGLSFTPEKASGLQPFEIDLPEATGYGAVIE